MQTFATEKIYQILLPLSLPDIAAFCRVNRQYSMVCQDPYFWRLKYENDFNAGNTIDPNDVAALIREFPDIISPDYPDNWRLAYQYRSLVQEYANINFAKRETLEEIKADLDSGEKRLIDVSASALRLLDLWNPKTLLPEFENAYGVFDADKTLEEREQEMDDVLESDGTRVGDKSSNLIFGSVVPDTDLVGFRSDLEEHMWFREEETSYIQADDIVTPRIITIVVQIYQETYQNVSATRRLPLDELPQFEYVYTSTGLGFTLKELYLLAKESVKKYLYIVSLLKGRSHYNLNKIRCNQIRYRDGKYYPEAFRL